MTMSIRDPRANELAGQYAAIHRTTKTAAIIKALEMALAQEKNRIPLVTRVDAIADAFLGEAPATGHAMSKEDYDNLWGN